MIWNYFSTEQLDCKLNYHLWRHDCSLKKNSGLNRIRNHDLCDNYAVVYQLSYQANWELIMLWVHNILVDGEERKWIYEISYIWTAEKDMNTRLIIAATYTTA